MIQVSTSPSDIAMPSSGDVLMDIAMGVAVVAVAGAAMMAAATYGIEDIYWWARDRVQAAAQRFKMYRR